MTGDPYPWRPARVRVGTVGKAHGLDGAIRIASPCGWYGFRKGAALALDGRPVRIVRRGGTDLDPIVLLDAAADRTAAEALRGAALEVERDALPAPEPDAYFRFDLVGCEVRELASGRVLGRVHAVEDGVANDVLVLDDALPTRLPFVAALVPEVDVPARRIAIVDGLVPPPAPPEA